MEREMRELKERWWKRIGKKCTSYCECVCFQRSHLLLLPSSFSLLPSSSLLPQFEIIVDEDSTIGENQLFGTAYCTVGTLLDAAGGGEIQVRWEKP